jgi:very-short-patch-repair endonuclease
MRPESRTELADRAVGALARRQYGVVARWQLLEVGVTGRQIKLRLRSGRLHEVHRGVYLVGHTVPPAYAPEMSALLACGWDTTLGREIPAAVLSHRSAAVIWDLLPAGRSRHRRRERSPRGPGRPPPHPATTHVCVTVPPERNATRPRIDIRRAVLDRRDVRGRARLVLTSPPRTILDLAAELEPEDLEWTVAEASYRRLVSERELSDQLRRNPGKRGVPGLRRILDLPPRPSRTRSPAERRMLRLLRRAGMTGYETNARIHGYEVDVLWRAQRFAVEIDGYDGHSGRVAFERDRLKIATLKARGVDVLPVTPRNLREDPEGVLTRLLAALELVERRGRGGAARPGSASVTSD